MKVDEIHYDEQDRIGSVEVTMSVEEAALVAQLLRTTDDSVLNTLMRDGAKHGTEIFDVLLEELFNSHIDGGVDGFLKERGLKL